MPISSSATAAKGRSYIDIRRDSHCGIHQAKLDVSTLTSNDDADGVLPPGLPIRTDGAPVSGGTDALIGVIGPEPIKIGTDDIFANVITSGNLNKNAIEDNLGRSLSANELAALALIPAIRVL